MPKLNLTKVNDIERLTVPYYGDDSVTVADSNRFGVRFSSVILDKAEVRELIQRLQSWMEKGTFEIG